METILQKTTDKVGLTESEEFDLFLHMFSKRFHHSAVKGNYLFIKRTFWNRTLFHIVRFHDNTQQHQCSGSQQWKTQICELKISFHHTTTPRLVFHETYFDSSLSFFPSYGPLQQHFIGQVFQHYNNTVKPITTPYSFMFFKKPDPLEIEVIMKRQLKRSRSRSTMEPKIDSFGKFTTSDELLDFLRVKGAGYCMYNSSHVREKAMMENPLRSSHKDSNGTKTKLGQ